MIYFGIPIPSAFIPMTAKDMRRPGRPETYPGPLAGTAGTGNPGNGLADIPGPEASVRFRCNGTPAGRSHGNRNVRRNGDNVFPSVLFYMPLRRGNGRVDPTDNVFRRPIRGAVQ